MPPPLPPPRRHLLVGCCVVIALLPPHRRRQAAADLALSLCRHRLAAAKLPPTSRCRAFLGDGGPQARDAHKLVPLTGNRMMMPRGE